MIAVAPVLVTALPSSPAAVAETASGFRVLVFSRTEGFRHDSIDRAQQAIQDLAAGHGFEVVETEDPGVFTADQLRSFDVVLFLLTTGDVLDPDQEAALQGYVSSGGGFAGVHSAPDTEHGWPWFGRLVGARFASHPAVQPGRVRTVDDAHPSTRHLPRTWLREDEWYDFDRNPRRSVHVLLTLAERSYQGGDMGSDHPISWCHRVGDGRSWYTGGGHTEDAYGELDFQRHLLGGLRWAAGATRGDCDARTDRDVVTLLVSDGEAAGTIFADPGRCRGRRSVQLLSVGPGTDRVVGRDRTDRRGRWETRLEADQGPFRAVAPVNEGCRRLRSAVDSLGPA